METKKKGGGRNTSKDERHDNCQPRGKQGLALNPSTVTYPTSEWRTQASVAKIYVHWLQHSFLGVIVEKYILDQLSYKLHTLALCS
jgi:hypothetical protein